MAYLAPFGSQPLTTSAADWPSGSVREIFPSAPTEIGFDVSMTIPLFGLAVLGRTDILGSTVEDIGRWSPGGIVATLLAAAMEPATWGSGAWWSLLACVGYTAVFVFLGIRWFQWAAH